MKTTFILFLTFSAIFRCFAQQSVSTDFESKPYGTAYTLNIWQGDGFKTGKWDDGMNTRSMVDTSFSISGKKSLRITYPKGTFGPKENGAQVPINLPDRDQYFMSYWLRFGDDFDFNLGGKLPGLAGGELCSGGEKCDGTNGFTARFMWRKEGEAILYLYHMDKPSKWGEDIPLVYPKGNNVVFEKGKWYHIAERVKINSSGDAYNGEVEVWINGLKVLLRKGLRFVSNGEKVNRFYFSTFHGGGSSDWAPSKTCHIWIDKLSISVNKKDIAYSN